MGWAGAQTALYNAFRFQKRARKSPKDTTTTGTPQSLSRSLSTDDSGSENSSSVFNQEDDMQLHLDMMDQREAALSQVRCPCGCPGPAYHEERDGVRIRTKEIVPRSGLLLTTLQPNPSTPSLLAPTDTLERCFGFEVLRFQGQNFTPEDIAPLWKKDCRLWLWKSTDLARVKSCVHRKLLGKRV